MPTFTLRLTKPTKDATALYLPISIKFEADTKEGEDVPTIAIAAIDKTTYDPPLQLEPLLFREASVNGEFPPLPERALLSSSPQIFLSWVGHDIAFYNVIIGYDESNPESSYANITLSLDGASGATNENWPPHDGVDLETSAAPSRTVERNGLSYDIDSVVEFRRVIWGRVTLELPPLLPAPGVPVRFRIDFPEDPASLQSPSVYILKIAWHTPKEPILMEEMIAIPSSATRSYIAKGNWLTRLFSCLPIVPLTEINLNLWLGPQIPEDEWKWGELTFGSPDRPQFKIQTIFWMDPKEPLRTHPGANE